MGLADEYLVKAEGWEQFEQPSKDKKAQGQLDFSHKIAKIFSGDEGKEVLSILVRRYLLNDIAQANDTQISIGRKQGHADIIKQFLAHIEISNNSK